MKNNISRRKFIDQSLKGAALFSAGGSYLLIQSCDTGKEYDLVIKGGMVYDGLGNPGRELDIAINNGKIVHIADNISTRKARQVIKASGFAVAPGFIDAHTHSDTELLANPKAESHVRQGITTDIGGNCGSSPFPIANEVFAENKRRLKEELDIDLNWNDIQGFFSRVQKQGIALNFATMVGFGNIRGKVIGFNDQPPTDSQVNEMKKIMEENMRFGAIGLSTGLEYTPDSYARTEEIIRLCQVVSEMNGIYATHIRDEGDHVMEAIDEALTIAKQAGVSIQISHLKAAYPGNWHKNAEILTRLEEAEKNGTRVLFDRYPYIAASTGLDLFFPNWAKQGSTEEFIARLKDPDLDQQFRSHYDLQEKKIVSWDKVTISYVFNSKNKGFEGKNLLEASAMAGKNPYDFMRDLIIEDENRVEMVVFNMDEDNLKRIIAHPLWIAGSDGNAVAPYGILSKGKPHPRYYGTFPRILGKYVREEKVISLPEAIQKMTSASARKFGLAERGQLTEGYHADIVVFNQETVADKATWQNPHQYPEGINYVIVNGEVVVSEGEHTGKLPGKILRKDF